MKDTRQWLTMHYSTYVTLCENHNLEEQKIEQCLQGPGGVGEWERLQRDTEEPLGVMKMFYILIL